VAVERTTTPASNSKILTAKSRRERTRIRVIFLLKCAKATLQPLYNAIKFVARQDLSEVYQLDDVVASLPRPSRFVAASLPRQSRFVAASLPRHMAA
jgi:hypothetical protein